MSPDGTRIVYAADGRLFLRSVSEFEARAIPGTDPAISPVFSPDGQSLVFCRRFGAQANCRQRRHGRDDLPGRCDTVQV